LIGYQGNTVSKYKEKLLSLPHGWVKSLVIEETTGIF
jgi:hypothetical protein